MKKTKNYKKQLKAKKTVKLTTSEEDCKNAMLMDTAISTKSSSLIVSSLYLFSLAVIMLALAVIIGLITYVFSYNFEAKSNGRFSVRAENVKVKNKFQEEDDDNTQLSLDDAVLPYLSDSNHQNKLHGQNTIPKKNKKGTVTKPAIYLEHRDLFRSYTFDFQRALKLRHEAMKKYSYQYSMYGVDKRHNLSLQEFYDVYDGKWPVIITDAIPVWPAFNWSIKTLQKKYGDARVAMVTYNIRGDNSFKGDKEGFSVPFGLFMDNLNSSREDSWTYVQDEVFLAQFPELRAQVLDTIYSKEDFFNLFPKEIRPWDCLLLWGTAYSRSTLHVDPYNWTGTNAVISGHKRWKLLPPGQDKHLSIYPDAGCGFPLDCHKYNSKYDTYLKNQKILHKLEKLQYLEVDQMSGEMLFIPTGWFHQAYNIVPTLAVSGEIMNRNNYLAVLEEIFNVGTIPRSILPHDVEKMSPEELVKFVMTKIPADVLRYGEQWTKMNIDSLYNPPPELQTRNNG